MYRLTLKRNNTVLKQIVQNRAGALRLITSVFAYAYDDASIHALALLNSLTPGQDKAIEHPTNNNTLVVQLD